MTRGPRHPDTILGKTCATCHQPIPWRNSPKARAEATFCSERCRTNRNPEYIPGKTCVSCGNPIPWRPGIEARARATWCSDQCRHSASYSDPPKMCLACGEPIPWREGRFLREQSKFCSNHCKLSWQQDHPARERVPRETKPCATCGKPVEYLPSQKRASKNPNANIYCSRKCFGIGHSKTMIGRRPANGVYATTESFRSTIRREFYDRCSICGWSEAPCDVAHIIGRKNGGADVLENVTMLCPNHHRLFDLGLIPVETIQQARETVLRHPASAEH